MCHRGYGKSRILVAPWRLYRPVFAYFTADWCVTCKVNDRVALKTEATVGFFAEKDIKVLIDDWTNEEPAIIEILSRYGRAGVPMYLYFPVGAKPDEGRLLPQLLTPAIVREESDCTAARIGADVPLCRRLPHDAWHATAEHR